MAEDQDFDLLEESDTVSWHRRWLKRLGWFLAAIVTAALIIFAVLNSPIGKRLIVDQIASYAPASGLKVEIGSIRGDIYRDAILQDVKLSDPKGVFLTIPKVELDWRPLNWLSRGLDVRKLVADGGRLSRLPELLPGDPDAPILPDFDIRIDRLEISNLIIAAGVATDQDETLNLTARTDIRDGFVELAANGRIGIKDRIDLAMLVEPDGDLFDIDLDYHAPAGGVVSGLLGSDQGHSARIIGDGTWSNWLGYALVKQGEDRLAGLQLTNRSGQYGLLGEIDVGDGQSTLIGRALGQETGVIANGRVEDSVFAGTVQFRGSGLNISGEGEVDLAENRFNSFAVDAKLIDPEIFGADVLLRDATLQVELDGKFRNLQLEHQLTASELTISDISARELRQEGMGRYDGEVWTIPLDLSVAQIDTGVEQISDELKRGSLSGALTYSDGLVRIEPLVAKFPRVGARLALVFDPEQSDLRVRGPVNASGIVINGIGTAQGNGNVEFAIRGSNPWTFKSSLGGRVGDLQNSTVQNVMGDAVSFRGFLSSQAEAPLDFTDLIIRSPEIDMSGEASLGEEGFAFDAGGNHTRFGQFSLSLRRQTEGTTANLTLDAPYPAAGIRDVAIAIAPSSDGFTIDSEGTSALGRFTGLFGLRLPENAPAVLDIERFEVWETSVDGSVVLEGGGARGLLSLTGGGLDGKVNLAPVPEGQNFGADIAISNAVFGGTTAISIGEADLKVTGTLGEQTNRIEGDVSGRAIRYGTLFLGRVAARAKIDDGVGDLSAALVGRQGGRFNLQLDSNFNRDRIDAIARGNYSGTPISMARRAVLNRTGNGQWQLAPSGVTLGGGKAVLSGEFGEAGYSMDVKAVDVPLVLADLIQGEIDLGGTISGTANYSSRVGQPPVGEARVRVTRLSRTGLLVASKPIDIALVSSLEADLLKMQAVLSQGGNRVGWLDAKVANLPASGILYDRLTAGALDAALRYEGASEAFWRLAAVDAFDISGPVLVTAKAQGSLADPQVSGDLASSDLRVRSVLSGTDIDGVSVQGDFRGPKLNLRRFSGTAVGGGSVIGSGTVDLASLGQGRGPQLDIRAAANKARLVDARGLRATVTGPLRIVSSGVGGTIAGRLEIDDASWQLGTAADDIALPDITTREINLPSELERERTRTSPWRYLIDARARNRIDVDGLGLDSEWRGNMIIRGTTSDPRIGGEARVIRGSYSFAGTRFELTSGRITFDENVPIDPRLDILAETRRNGLNVDVTVRGNALSPEIAFSSDPALPEEEILAQLLFGGSITELAATDALQLGAAIASLRGGVGLDPINKLRSQIGLDRLRIIGADPALGRETGVALGENIGRRLYVELITDGRGYSATELEFRITSWLSLLTSVSTVGREGVVLEARRDY